MADKLAVIQAEESIKELRKIKRELPDLIRLFKELKTETSALNKAFNSSRMKDYTDAVKNLTRASRQFNNLQQQISAAMERLSRIERNNAQAAAELARQRRELAQSVREESRAREQLAREAAGETRRNQQSASAHAQLTRQVREARQKARDYGAEIMNLNQQRRAGTISMNDYRTRMAQLNRDFRNSTNEAIRLERELRRLNNATLPSNQRYGGLKGRVTDIIKGIGIFSIAQKAIGSVTSAAQKLGVEFYNTAVKLETLRFAQKAVFKTNEEVKNQNIFLTDIASKYGVEIISLTDAYTKFSASSQGTTLEGEKSKQIFEAVTKSSAMLGVTTDDTNGILRALGQMMSKGKVQAEELRGQLGDRMAGAFRLFADGMGVSTAQLDKMLKDGKVITEDVLPKFAAQLNKKYQLGLGEEIDTKQASIARIKNEWVDFVDAVESRTGIVSMGIAGISNSIVSLLQALKPSKEITVIEQQQEEFNILGIELRKNWSDQNKRKELIDKMIALNPLFLNGLDREKATLEDISKRIQDVNAQYVQKLILQEQENKITELVKDQAINYKDLAKILSENAVEYNSFSTTTKNALDLFSQGSLKYEDAESRIIRSTRAGSEERRKALDMLKDMNKIFTRGKVDGLFNYVRGIKEGNSAISEATGEYNKLVSVTNKLFGVQGQLLNMNGLLAKSYKTNGDVVNDRKKQIEEELRAAEGMGKNIALISNVWRERINGKWTTTNKKQTDGWYEEDGKIVKRESATIPEKEKKYTGAKLDGNQKDFLMTAQGVRDTEIANLKKRQLDLLISEEDYWIEYEKIVKRYSDKIQGFLKGKNAKEKQVEGAAYKKAIDAMEQTNKELYDLRSKRLEEENKKELNILERSSKQFEDASFLTDYDRLTKQIEIDDQIISKLEDYYEKQINLAGNSAQSVIEWERKRDEEIGKIYDERSKRQQEIPVAIFSSLEYQAESLRFEGELSFEKQKQELLANKKLTVEEKSAKLSILEKEEQIKANQREIDKLETLLGQLAAQRAINQLNGLPALLSPEQEQQIKEYEATVKRLKNENTQLQTDVDQESLDEIKKKYEALKDVLVSSFEGLGLGSIADEFQGLWDKLWEQQATWQEKAKKGFELVAAYASQLVENQTQKRIAALDEELKQSQTNSELEIQFINNRIAMLNGLDELSKDQLTERSRLEDQARTIKEQQLQRERLIAIQKAKAEQRAAAQQALINGLVGAAKSIPNWAQVAASVAAGALMAGLIMGKDPTPKYWKGREDGPAEWALTQERGREIIADKNDNILSLGSDKGATKTWLNKGDKVYTADQSRRILKDLGSMPKVGQNIFKRIANRSLSAPSVDLVVNTTSPDYSQKIIDGLAKKFEGIMNRNANPSIQRKNGLIIEYNGSKLPVVLGEYDLETGKETYYGN